MSKRSRKWNRRAFLRAAGVGASAAALAPFLPLPQAEGAAGPRRMIIITGGQGTDMSRWRPSGTETDFVLSEILDPLVAYQDRMIVLDGVDNEAAIQGDFGGHFGMSTLWTGMPVMSGPLRDEGVSWPQGPSVDRLISAHVHAGTTRDAFYWGTWPASLSGGNQGPNGIAHHRGPDSPIEPELFPARAFDRMFAGVTGDEAEIARRRFERQSVIDVVNGDLGRIRSELPEVDRDRMDAHLAGIRRLEERLAELHPVCTVPPVPGEHTESEVRNYDNHPMFTDLQFELMAHALACDLTRVACFQWPHSEGRGSFMPSVGYREFGSFHARAHQMSYEEVGGEVVTDTDRIEARRDVANLTRYRSEAIASLLDRMLPEVRACSLLVWGSEMSEGGTHSNRNIPLVMVQGQDLDYFSAGRYLQWGDYDPYTRYRNGTYYGGQPMNKVLVSMCQAMGMSDVTQVGLPEIEAGELTELRG